MFSPGGGRSFAGDGLDHEIALVALFTVELDHGARSHPQARQRLMNIRMVKPDLAAAVENYLINAASSGRINRPLSDEELKQLDKWVRNNTVAAFGPVREVWAELGNHSGMI